MKEIQFFFGCGERCGEQIICWSRGSFHVHFPQRWGSQQFCLFPVVKFALSLKGMWWTLTLRWGCSPHGELVVSGPAWQKRTAICVGEQAWVRVHMFRRLGESAGSYCPRVEMSSQPQLHRHRKVMSLPHWLCGVGCEGLLSMRAIHMSKNRVWGIFKCFSVEAENFPKQVRSEWNGNRYSRALASESDMIEAGVWLLALQYPLFNILEPQYPYL